MSIVRRVAAAAEVERGHVQKVLKALTEVLKEDLQEKSKVRIPGLLCATVRIVKDDLHKYEGATQMRLKKVEAEASQALSLAKQHHACTLRFR